MNEEIITMYDKLPKYYIICLHMQKANSQLYDITHVLFHKISLMPLNAITFDLDDA